MNSNPTEREEAARAALAKVIDEHTPVAFACSFGAEDMVLVDLLARWALPVEIFTLDTGRLPAETHALIAAVRKRYALDVAVALPDPTALRAYVAAHGVDGFYDSVDARKACCAARKVEPLRRALHGKGAWITGLRREQAPSRAAIAPIEYDAAFGLFKANPLADWSHEDVWRYLRRHGVPYNALHDRGYASIGCEPCTRAVRPGEDPRAGRWWWEQEGAHKECGLHASS